MTETLAAADLADQLSGAHAPFVLDVREAHELAAGSVPGAVHIPMSELPARVDELAPFLDRDEPLVITCRSGGRVTRVMPWLEQQGYEVANLDVRRIDLAEALSTKAAAERLRDLII